MTSRNRERNSVHDRTHTHLRAIQEGQSHQGASVGELLNDIKTNTGNINLNVDSLEVNTDTLEAKIQATNDKLDIFSGAGNNNVGEGQVKLQIYNYGRDVSAGNYKPMVVDGDGHLQVDCLTTALPTGAATEAKQDVMEASLTSIETDIESTNTKLDTISGQLVDDSKSVANGVNSVNTNVITQNTKFFNKAAFLAANVDPTTNPPAATTELLLTQDIPQQFQMITLTASADSIDTRVAETNSILTTIDTDTGNIDTKLGAISTLTGANNTIHAAIKTDTGNIDTKLPSALTGSGNLKVCIQELGNEGSERLNTEASVSQLPAALTGAGFLKVSLEDMSTSGTGISTSAKQDTTNTKLDTIETTLTAIETDAAALEVLQTSTNTKLDTLETSLTAIETDIESVIGTASAAHSTKGMVLMGKVGDLTSDGIHSDTGIAQNDCQFIACDPFGNIGITGNFITENSIEFNSGNKTDKTQRVVIATDDIPIALVNTKLDTLEATLTAIETDAAALEVLQTTTNSKLTTIDSVMDNILVDTSAIKVDAAALEVLQTTTNTKLDTLETTLTAIETDAAALEVLQTTTNSKLTTIDSVMDNILIDTSAIKVDAAALEVLQTATNSKLDDVITLLNSLNNKLAASDASNHYGNP